METIGKFYSKEAVVLLLGACLLFMSLTMWQAGALLAYIAIALFLKNLTKNEDILALPFLFLPVVSAIRPEFTLLIFAVTLLIRFKFDYKMPLFIKLIIVGALVQSIYSASEFTYIVQKYSFHDWYKTIGTGLSWFRALMQAFLWYVAFIYFKLLSQSDSVRRKAAKLLLFGACGAIISFILQAFVSRDFFIGMNRYWISLKRFSGSFSDPNAAGISLFLIMGLAIYVFSKSNNKIRWPLIPFILAVFCTAMYTGSRSFILGMASMLFLYFGIYRRKFFYYLLAFGVVTLILFNVFTYYQGIKWLSVLPPAVERVLKTCYFPQMLHMLAPRFYFYDIGWHIFLNHPWTGIGLDKFYLYFPFYSQNLGYSGNGWSDNACSLYLGILTDGGLLLLLGICLFIFSVRWKKDSPSVLKILFYASLVIFTFSHILFAEVALIFALMSAFLFNYDRDKMKIHRGYTCFLLCVFALCQYYDNTNLHGLYNWEKRKTYYEVWTAKEAVFPINCQDDKAILKLSVPRRSRKKGYPIQVTYTTPYESDELKILDRRPVERILNCNSDASLQVKISSSDAWLPTRDPRLLGIRVYFDL